MPQMRREGRKAHNRLAPPWVILSAGTAIVLLMLSIFPSSSWFRQLSGTGGKEEADSLKVLLLKNLILKGQGGPALRQDYALQLGLTGNYAEAFGVLDTLIRNQPDSLVPLRRLQAHLAQRALSSRPGPGLTALAKANLNASLEGFLAATAPAEALAWAAQAAGVSGREDVAYALYLRLAGQDTARSGEWDLKAARVAAHRRDFQAATELYAAAASNIHATQGKKAAILEGLKSLQAAERLDLALSLGERSLAGAHADPEILAFLVRLARAANRPKEAGKYAEMLVRPDAVAGLEP